MSIFQFIAIGFAGVLLLCLLTGCTCNAGGESLDVRVVASGSRIL